MKHKLLEQVADEMFSEAREAIEESRAKMAQREQEWEEHQNGNCQPATCWVCKLPPEIREVAS